MEAGSLTFTVDEYVVLETVEFDEDVQREQRVRFYTFDEQQTDAYEQLIPQGRTTQYQRNTIRDLLHRYKELYDAFIVPTDTSYELRGIETRKDLPWVQPVTSSREFAPYSWDNWRYVVETSNKNAQAYPRMISGLPRITTKNGDPIARTIEFVDSTGMNPLRVLPVYELTRTQVHSDRTIDVIRVPVEGTSDRIALEGYYIQPRKLPIPNPLVDHPFLSTTEGRFLETTAPLEEVIPSLGAVMEHGVPITNDPYVEAKPFLKLYDVRLSDIPWSMWKSKFPPVEEFIPTADVPPIPFPKADRYPPSDKVLEIYETEYSPGLSVREWLMRQDDGGEAVVRALLSRSIDNGSVQSIPGVDLPMPAYPETSVEDCRLMGLDFNKEFIHKGVFRRTWKWDSKKDKDTITTVCVPLEFIRQERAKVGYLNRKPWRDTTPADILESRLKVLRAARMQGVPEAAPPEEITPAKEPSPLRADVLVILNDPHRVSADKIRDIRDLIADTTQARNIHSDAEGRFVICEHTLAILEGALAEDRRVFYDKWTVKEDGFRVCTSCGEQINNDDFAEQTNYTDDGFIIRSSEALEIGPTFFKERVTSIITGLNELSKLFDEKRASDRLLFLLISFLQVLPDEKQLNPLIVLMHEIEKKLGSVDKPEFRVAKGAIGIATAIILLQTHQPQLIPRRSFGPKPVKLSGYPRDLPQPESYSIIDALIGVLRKTFDEFQTPIKGVESDAIRSILGSPGKMKDSVLTFLKLLLADSGVKQKLASVKVEAPTVEEPKTLLSQTAPKEFGKVVGYELCPSVGCILPGLQRPLLHGTSIQLDSKLFPSDRRIEVRPAVSVRTVPKLMPKPEIAGLYKSLTGLKSEIAINDQYRRNLMIASRLADISRKPLSGLRNVDPTQKDSELRDISKGYLGTAIRDVDNVEKRRLTDVSLYALSSDYATQKRQATTVSATERLTFTNKLSKKSDQERMIDGELLRIGLAPYIMTLEMREEIAIGAFQRMVEETGVGGPRDFGDQGETSNAGADNGDYGDYNAAPSNDGRDHEQPSMNDDPLNSI